MKREKTLMEKASRGEINEIFKMVAVEEDVKVENLVKKLSEGTVVIPYNRCHDNLKPIAIGLGMSTKINANIGTSENLSSLKEELLKLKTAVECGADAVMDLSTGSKIKKVRKAVIKNTQVPVGTVPIYQVGVEVISQDRSIVEMDVEDIFKVIEEQAEDGVDFITVHCGLTMKAVEYLQKEGRINDIVSRGGSFLTGWMLHNQKENPLYKYYDRLLEIASKYDLTLSLGDGMRPGCLMDATDRAQIYELLVLGELVDRAREAGVQTIVEGPGHVPFDQIECNMKLEKELCSNAPFYVLGPLVTDSAPGYDHIAAAIGGTMAAYSGADFLCYVTPAEHLGLPNVDDVREGVIAAKIAAHAADLALGKKKALIRDAKMAKARKNLNWEKQMNMAIYPEKARKLREKYNRIDFKNNKTCTMCGQYCALKITEKALSE